MFSYQDYAVIGVYFGFILLVGLFYRQANRDSGDYFRGGGSMTWWMTGATVFMAQFSAWTFIGCGGRIYKTGTLIVFTMFLMQAIFGIVMYFKTVTWYRRMRVVTAGDAIYRRYGRATEQIFSWNAVISQFLLAGIGLYTLSIFMAPLLGISMKTCVIGVGAIVVFMSVTGGAWAVVASDFVQLLVLAVIIIITVVLTLTDSEVGGISGFFSQLPEYQFNWTLHDKLPVLITFLIGSAMLQATNIFNLTLGAGRYVYVRSDEDAKKACLLFIVGFTVGPLIWFIPVMAASFLYPDLSDKFPMLNIPHEGAYLAIAERVLPKGMLGMMACGIFAATMSAMDSGLNKNSGIFVYNVYKPLFRPKASQAEMLLVGKIATLAFGVTMIIGGVWAIKLMQLNIYEFTQHFNSLFMLPLVLPFVFGLIFKKTPKATPWISMILVAILCWIMKFAIDYECLSMKLGWGELSRLELNDFREAVIYIVCIPFGAIIYLIATWLYKPGCLKIDDQKRVDDFFEDVNTPVTADSAEHKHTDAMQYKKLGQICLAYGSVLTLGVALPNDLKGRVCFLICGIFIAGIGAMLYRGYLKRNRVNCKS